MFIEFSIRNSMEKVIVFLQLLFKFALEHVFTTFEVKQNV